MFTQQNNIFVTSLCFILSLQLPAVTPNDQRFQAAAAIAQETYKAFINMFQVCIGTNVPSEQFKVDNMKGFINYPSRTTVGSAPKLTSNRKFFANIVSTREFKEMLDKDVETLRVNLIKKMNYCESTIMGQNIMKDFYDREVDQTKI